MDKLKDTSQFCPWPADQFIPLDTLSRTSAYNSSSFSRFSKSAAHFLQKIRGNFRALLGDILKDDGIFFLRKHEGERNQFLGVINFLKSQGMIRDISLRQDRFNDAPAFTTLDIFPEYSAGITDGVKKTRSIGHSFGKNITEVFAKATGEFLERYFLSLYKKGDLFGGTEKALRKKGVGAVSLKSLAGFSEEQKGAGALRAWDDDSEFMWQSGVQISTGKKVYIPAQCIYWNYSTDGKPFLREPNSNGGGGMFSEEEAILAGLYELIERDAFLIFWLNTLAPPRIDPTTILDPEFQSYAQESKRHGFEVFYLNTTLDTGVPSFIVVIKDTTGVGPYFSLGGGCNYDPIKGLKKAFFEAWGVYYSVRRRKNIDPPYSLSEPYRPFCDYSIGQEERLLLWADAKMAQRFSFFLEGKLISFSEALFDYHSVFSSKKNELGFLVQRIESLGNGYEVYVYRAIHPILKNLSYKVIRALVPQLVPLYLNETFAPLDAERLRKVPGKFGYRVNEKFNPWPHPFP